MYIYETPFGSFENQDDAIRRCAIADFGPECIRIREIEVVTEKFMGKEIEMYKYL